MLCNRLKFLKTQITMFLQVATVNEVDVVVTEVDVVGTEAAETDTRSLATAASNFQTPGLRIRQLSGTSVLIRTRPSK